MIKLIDDIYWEEVSGTNEVQIIKKHEIQGLIIIKLMKWPGWTFCGGQEWVIR